MSDFRVIKTTTNYVLKLLRNFFSSGFCFCSVFYLLLFFACLFVCFSLNFAKFDDCISGKNFGRCGNITPGDQCLEAIISPQNYERLHKPCIRNVQFVQFLTAYLGIVIRFVNFPGSSVDRKAQFVAG